MCCVQRIKAVAAPVKGGASSRPKEYNLKNSELLHPLDPNGIHTFTKPSHTIVETTMWGSLREIPIFSRSAPLLWEIPFSLPTIPLSRSALVRFYEMILYRYIFFAM